MAEEMKAGIETKIVETDEKPFIPGGKKISVVLQPKEEEAEFYAPSAPIPAELETLPAQVATLKPAEKSVVINVEATGIMPYNSRVQHIAIIDLDNPDEVTVFFDENEEKIIKDFAAWFNSSGATRLIGYNIAFDYRFIFAKAIRYGVQLIGFDQVFLYDVMQRLKQVKLDYVFNLNKPGTMDVWVKYLFGIDPPMTQAEELDAYAKKQYKETIEYNKYKTKAAYLLYLAIEYVLGGQSGE